MTETTDPTTQRMRDETGHDCIACPTRVRDLMATVHNALVQWDAVQAGQGDRFRLARKMERLRESAAQMEEISAGHFAALNAWRRP